jgi:hypothetical protein
MLLELAPKALHCFSQTCLITVQISWRETHKVARYGVQPRGGSPKIDVQTVSLRSCFLSAFLGSMEEPLDGYMSRPSNSVENVRAGHLSHFIIARRCWCDTENLGELIPL